MTDGTNGAAWKVDAVGDRPLTPHYGTGQCDLVVVLLTCSARMKGGTKSPSRRQAGLEQARSKQAELEHPTDKRPLRASRREIVPDPSSAAYLVSGRINLPARLGDRSQEHHDASTRPKSRPKNLFSAVIAACMPMLKPFTGTASRFTAASPRADLPISSAMHLAKLFMITLVTS